MNVKLFIWKTSISNWQPLTSRNKLIFFSLEYFHQNYFVIHKCKMRKIEKKLKRNRVIPWIYGLFYMYNYKFYEKSHKYLQKKFNFNTKSISFYICWFFLCSATFALLIWAWVLFCCFFFISLGFSVQFMCSV